MYDDGSVGSSSSVAVKWIKKHLLKNIIQLTVDDYLS